jgi:hypothetical protein
MVALTGIERVNVRCRYLHSLASTCKHVQTLACDVRRTPPRSRVGSLRGRSGGKHFLIAAACPASLWRQFSTPTFPSHRRPPGDMIGSRRFPLSASGPTGPATQSSARGFIPGLAADPRGNARDVHRSGISRLLPRFSAGTDLQPALLSQQINDFERVSVVLNEGVECEADRFTMGDLVPIAYDTVDGLA